MGNCRMNMRFLKGCCVRVLCFFWGVMLMHSGLSAGEVAPVLKDGALVLVESGSNANIFSNSTCGWIKGSNLKPKVSEGKDDISNYFDFNYSGNKGFARSVAFLTKGWGSVVPEGKKVTGVRLLIDYEKNDFSKIILNCRAQNGGRFSRHFALIKGNKEYLIKNNAFDWGKTSMLSIKAGVDDRVNTDFSKFKFKLREITFIMEDSKKIAKNFDILVHKKFFEILPKPEFNQLQTFYPFRKEGEFKKDESPFKAYISYDNENLYVNTEAEFLTPPMCNVDKYKGPVFRDEAQEIFLSPWNDNWKKIQVCYNVGGFVQEFLIDYDKVAAAVTMNKEWQLEHEKQISYSGKLWKSSYVYPFANTKINLEEDRIVGFQLTQTYKKREGKYMTLSWSKTRTKFPDPYYFGALIFNKKPFGDGDISITSVSCNAGENKGDFLVGFSCPDIPEGDYTLEKRIVAPDKSIFKTSEKFSVNKGTENYSAEIRDAKNLNGLYTIYLLLHNSNGDIKASAVNIENVVPLKNLFAERIFCPKPKNVVWGDGNFLTGECNTLSLPEKASKRTIKTAEIFAAKLYGYSGSKYILAEGKDEGIVLRLSENVIFEGKKTKLKPEGYYLKVDGEKVVITGADEPGLYYGTRTFLQLIKQPMVIEKSIPASCVEILDWPDLPNRMCRLDAPWHFKDHKFEEHRGVDYLIKWTDRYVAGTKQNRFNIDFSRDTIFRRRPEFCGSERVYTLDDLRKFAEFCRDNFIEVLPAFQIGGHARHWLVPYHPEMAMKGYPKDGDTAHPDHDSVVFPCIQDIIDALGAKYLFNKNDEWWQKRGTEKPDELCRNGKTYAETFLDFNLRLHKYLSKQGVRMAMFEDMLSPYHSGKRYDIYKVIDRFPKDVLITCWGINPDGAAKYFHDKGFEVWGNRTSFNTYGSGSKYINGYAAGIYSFGNGSMGVKPRNQSYIILKVIWSADYAWNFRAEESNEYLDNISSGRLCALTNMLSVDENPHVSEKTIPVYLEKLVNTKFASSVGVEFKSMPAGKVNVGNIDMVISDDANNSVLLDAQSKVQIPVRNKFSSLIFLHTASMTEDDQKKAYKVKRNWPHGFPAGDYVVTYKDNTAEKIPVRIGENIQLYDVPWWARATNESRFQYYLQDKNGKDYFLYQCEWVNPHPDKEITDISWEAYSKAFKSSVYLFAITGRCAEF